MTGKQYKAAIDRLGSNQIEFARFLDLSIRASRYYAINGPPVPVAMLLRVMVARGISIEHVNKLMGRNESYGRTRTEK